MRTIIHELDRVQRSKGTICLRTWLNKKELEELGEKGAERDVFIPFPLTLTFPKFLGMRNLFVANPAQS